MRLEVSQSHQRFNKHLSNYLVSFCAEFINNSSVQKVTLSGRNQSCIKDPQLIVPQFSMSHLQGQCWQTICLLHLPVISYANLIKYWLITLNPYQSPLWPWLKWIDNWVTTSAVQPLLRNHGLLSVSHWFWYVTRDTITEQFDIWGNMLVCFLNWSWRRYQFYPVLSVQIGPRHA